jgi:tetratricopeptide (TPR) repeat protein
MPTDEIVPFKKENSGMEEQLIELEKKRTNAWIEMLDIMKSELERGREINKRVIELEGKMSALPDKVTIDPKVIEDLMSLPYPKEELEKAALILGIMGLLPKNEDMPTTVLEEKEMGDLIEKFVKEGVIHDLVDRTKEVEELKERINDLEGKMSALPDKVTKLLDPKVIEDLMSLPYPKKELEKAALILGIMGLLPKNEDMPSTVLEEKEMGDLIEKFVKEGDLIEKFVKEGVIQDLLERTKEVEELKERINDLEQQLTRIQLSEERKQHLLKIVDESIIKALHKKGVLQLKKGLYDDAHNCFHEIIERNPNIKEAWLNLGIALGKLGQVEKEIECYDKAIEIDEKYALAKSNREDALKNVGGKEPKV